MTRVRRLFRHQPMARWTPAIALRRTACRVEDAKAALVDIIAIWGDVDQGFVDTAERVIQDLDTMLAEQREHVRERLEYGEHVGP